MSELRPSRPSLLRRVARNVARATMPLWRPMSGRRLLPLWAVVHHRGRRTGREHSTPVQIRATPDEFVIALPFGGATQWLRNVEAAGGCTITWRGRDHRADAPRIVGRDEAAAAFGVWERPLLRIVGIESFVRLRRTDAVAGRD